VKKALSLMLAFVLVCLSGCSSTISNNEVWQAVNDKEFRNDFNEIGPGTGLYFYEKGESKYCLFMIYGSGIPVLGVINYEIEIEGSGVFRVLSASEFESEFFQDPSQKDDFAFEYSLEGILFDGLMYEETSYDTHSNAMEIFLP